MNVYNKPRQLRAEYSIEKKDDLMMAHFGATRFPYKWYERIYYRIKSLFTGVPYRDEGKEVIDQRALELADAIRKEMELESIKYEIIETLDEHGDHYFEVKKSWSEYHVNQAGEWFWKPYEEYINAVGTGRRISTSLEMAEHAIEHHKAMLEIARDKKEKAYSKIVKVVR